MSIMDKENKKIQWPIVASIFIIVGVLFIWAQYLIQRGPVRHTINYTQFMEQLEANNIKSISIRNLRINGEFQKEVSVEIPYNKITKRVTYFQTFLPSFQGEGLILALKNKGVLINVEPNEKGSLLWQFLIGALPWVLLVGIWILIM